MEREKRMLKERQEREAADLARRIELERIKEQQDRRRVNEELQEQFRRHNEEAQNLNDKIKSKSPRSVLNISEQRADLTERNEGDNDLNEFLGPLLKQIKGDLVPTDSDALKNALNDGTLLVTGVRLWNAIHSESWRHREAAA